MTILRTLGSGGFADVFLARDESTRRLVALKQARVHDSQAAAALAREFSLVAPLVHPGLAAALDFFPGGPAEPPAIVFELLDGQLSEQACRDASRPEVLRWAAGLAETLDFLHRLGLVHGDIKPANVFITTDGVPRLIDFGLAGAPGVQSGGSPATAAPEVLEQARGGTESDLFSLGATLFFWLFGRFPAGETLAARLAALRRRPALPQASELPRGVRGLLRDLLSPDPEERPSSAREVAHRLGAEGIHPAARLARPEARARALPLLEREPALEDLLAAAQAPAGGFVALSGPEGAGRSRLLEELARQARLSGKKVLARSGDLGQLPGADPALAVALRSLAEQGPLALLVDDADLLFPEARESLLALPGRLVNPAGLLVVCALDSPPGHPGWTVLVPAPLSEGALGTLWEALLPGPPAPPSLIPRLLEASEGIPGKLVGLAVEAVRRGVVTWTAAGWEKTALEQVPLESLVRPLPAPEGLSAGLTPDQRRLAAALAAAAGPASFEILAAAAGLGLPRAAGALRGLLAQDIARRRPGGDLQLAPSAVSAFAAAAAEDPLVHERLLRGLARTPPGTVPERARWMGRMGRAAAGAGRSGLAARLVARGVGAALRAGRAEIAGEVLSGWPSSFPASPFVEGAAGEAWLARGKPEQAAAHFEIAARGHREGGRKTAAGEAWLRVARARGGQGRYDEARQALDQARGLAETPAGRASCALEEGIITARAGDYPKALELVERAWSEAPAGSLLQVRLRAARGRCLVLAGQPAAGERELAAAAEALESGRDASLWSALTLARVQAALAGGRPQWALDLAGEARGVLLDRGDAGGLGLLDGLAADAACRLGLLERALESARRAVAWREIEDHPEWLPAALERLARIHWVLGQVIAARAAGHQAVRRALRSSRPGESAGALGLLAQVYAVSGEAGKGRRFALAALARSRQAGDPALALEAAVALAAVDRLDGKPGRDLGILKAALDRVRGQTEAAPRLPEALALFARGLPPAEGAAAARLAGRAFDQAQRQGDFDAATLALSILAELNEEKGDAETAARLRERNRARIDEAALALTDLKSAALFRERPDRAGLRAQTSTRNHRRLEALYASVADLNSSRDPAQVVQTLLDRGLSALGAERGAVVLAREGGALEVVAARQVEPETAEDALRLSRTILERASGGEAILAVDPAIDPRFAAVHSVRRFSIHAVLCVPLALRRRPVGAMYVDSRDPLRRFDQQDLRFLEALADHAALALDNARAFQQLERENLELRAEVGARGKLGGMVGSSAPMQALYRAIESAAPTGLPVLVVGPSGSGKELAGKAVHRMGPHPEGPFVPVNCAALPETILEGLLFGHEKGAFTGADRARAGLIMQAAGGTLFLDEIGDMPYAMQAKLLRVLEQREVQPLGSARRQAVDFRLVCATHRNLEVEVGEGRFRHDLLYRIDVLRLRIPPLADRLEDLPLLVNHLLGRLEKNGLGPFRAAPALITRLAAWSWPGNVRELENTLSRLALQARGNHIDEAALAADPELARQFGLGNVPAGPAQLDQVEREAIRRALEITGGHREQAARLLGIGRATLFRKIREFHLESAGKRPAPPPA